VATSGTVRANLQQFQPNRFQHAVDVFVDLSVAEPQHGVAMCAQNSLTPCISRNLSLARMGRSINFDDEARFKADKIDNVT